MNHRHIRNAALAACVSLSVPFHAANSSESTLCALPSSALTASVLRSDASPWQGLEAERAVTVAASGTQLRSLVMELAEDTGATFRFATRTVAKRLAESELTLSGDYVVDADQRWTFVENVLADNGYVVTVAQPAGASIFTVHLLNTERPAFTNLNPLEVSFDDRALLAQHPATYFSMLAGTGKAVAYDLANWIQVLAKVDDRLTVAPVGEHELLLRGLGAPLAECVRVLVDVCDLGPDVPDSSMPVGVRSAKGGAAGEGPMRLAATGGKDAPELASELNYIVGEFLRIAPVGREQVLVQAPEGDLDLVSKLIELVSSQPTETVELDYGDERLIYVYTGSLDAKDLGNALRTTLDGGGESARLLPSGDHHLWLRGAEVWTSKVRALVDSPGASRGR